VAGGAATLVAPGDAQGLADAIDAELSGRPGSGQADAGLRQRGLDIVARHNWAMSADRHVEAYQHAARRPGPLAR